MDFLEIFRTVDGSRTAILRDLGSSIREVPFQFFKDNILPQLPGNVHVPTVLEKLADRGHIIDGRWKAFPRDPYMYAKKSGGSTDYDLGEKEREKENAVFAHLTTVVNAIEECVEGKKKMTTKQSAKAKLSGTTEYESSPDKVPVCCFDEKTGRPNAYFVFKQRFLDDREDRRRLWRDIAATAEFKLKDTRETLQDDVKKICWNLYKTMLEDPRRRFVFGFTIENTRTRIWTGNRTEVLVSEPFNFITDHEKLVHFCLSMLYGSETELGLDPTMSIFSASDNVIPRYDIQVRVMNESTKQMDIRTYRTTELINDDGAKSFRGSGTRAWEVVPVVNGIEQSDTRHVLKDHWVDDDRQHEGAILDEILNEPGLEDKVRRELRELFLTQVARGDVYITDEDGRNEKVDGTRTLATRGAEVPKDVSRFWLLIPLDYKSSHAVGRVKKDKDSKSDGTRNLNSADGVSHEVTTIDSEPDVTVYKSKHHYRIVFAERCKALSQERSLRSVFLALSDIVSGLVFLHMCGPGWVHRDLSTGNILEVPDGGTSKLSDLEYAKRLDKEYKHALRTGTENFMAVEVDHGGYLFRERHRTTKQVDHVIDNVVARRERRRANGLPSTPEPARGSSSAQQSLRKPFFYNPLHDLESIWWIAVYFVIHKETGFASRESSTPDAMENITYAHLTEDQRKYARSLFQHSGIRSSALQSNDDCPFDDRLRALPKHLSTISSELIDLRQAICTRYKEIEKPDFVIDKTVCEHVYPIFLAAFDRIVDSLSKQDILVAPLKPDPEEEVRKGIRAAQRAAETHTPPAKRRKIVALGATTSTAPAQASTSKITKTRKVVGPTTDSPLNSTRTARPRTRAVQPNDASDTAAAGSSSSMRITRSRSRALAEQADKEKGVARALSKLKRKR